MFLKQNCFLYTGGHPRPWNAVSQQCVGLLEDLLKIINDANAKLAIRWESRGYRTSVVDKTTFQPPHLLNQQAYEQPKRVSEPKTSLNWVWDIFDRSRDEFNADLLLQDWQLHVWNVEGARNIVFLLI